MDSIHLLANSVNAFVDKLLIDLKVNKAVATGMVEKSLMLCTSLAPVIGYDQASKVAKGAFAEGTTIREYCIEHKLLTKAQLDELLDARVMTEPA